MKASSESIGEPIDRINNNRNILNSVIGNVKEKNIKINLEDTIKLESRIPNTLSLADELRMHSDQMAY